MVSSTADRAPRSSRQRRLATKLGAVTPREVLTTLHVLALITFVELTIRWVSLPRLTRLLGVRLDLGSASPPSRPYRLSTLPPRARRRLRCTRRVANHWPFSAGPCLRRSLVAGRLLRDLDPSLRLGVAGSGDELHAHSWLEIDGRPLERLAGFNAFVERSGA